MRRNKDFQPIVFEITGGMHDSAVEFVRKVAKMNGGNGEVGEVKGV